MTAPDFEVEIVEKSCLCLLIGYESGPNLRSALAIIMDRQAGGLCIFLMKLLLHEQANLWILAAIDCTMDMACFGLIDM